ncbi:helix-turn-helix domain-containing protein [Haliangium sp.]|uniref:helix-turn-helix domain-containing protein n=1 Tax=Haliangium sp. TaxID=2663208 RepID=UPI003D126930
MTATTTEHDPALAESIGTQLRGVRSRREWTQAQTAKRLALSTEFYARLERGHALPSTPTLVRLCQVLQISADTLLGTEDAPLVGPDPDPPRVRKVLRRLRRADPRTLRMVKMVLDALAEQEARRRARRARRVANA